MDRESFLDTIRQQYAEEIQSAYLSCEHTEGARSLVDISSLQSKIQKLMKAAVAEGLPANEFEELVKSTLPDGNGERIAFKKSA